MLLYFFNIRHKSNPFKMSSFLPRGHSSDSPESSHANELQRRDPKLSWLQAYEEAKHAAKVQKEGTAAASAAATAAAATAAAASAAASAAGAAGASGASTSAPLSSKRLRSESESESPKTAKGRPSDESDGFEEEPIFGFVPRTRSVFQPSTKKIAYAATPRKTASEDDELFLVSTPRCCGPSSSPSSNSSSNSSPSPSPTPAPPTRTKSS